jgi:methanogenic corrinoid protein MtbC1
MEVEQLGEQYLELVLAGLRHQASSLILRAVEGGAPIKAIYLEVFQPALREVGRRWERNEISIAQEHLATAVTQLVMSQLYPRVFSSERRGRTLVATCLGGELHEVGVRMVADFFEMAGWDTYYLGANTPEDAVLGELRRVKADLLAVSVTISAHLGRAATLIDHVRREENPVKILVGGLPFLARPELARELGADGTALDAEAAVLRGEELCG